MKKHVLLAAAAALAAPAFAQEADAVKADAAPQAEAAAKADAAAAPKPEPMKAKKRKADYYSVTLVDFKSGREGDAREIIDKYFVAAAEKAGSSMPDMDVTLLTGKYDMMLVWKMKNGPADMEWEMTPDDASWFNAMADVAGGPGKANEIWEEYLSLVQSSETMLAFAEE
ncbi:MAG: hypothetical protein AAGC56_11585 [Pseudomonadota bacterium]